MTRTAVQTATTPPPAFVMSPDGLRIATYDVGDPAGPVVLAVHGFASSAQVNWFATGWVRELVRAGYRVLALDQRGHGASQKPHDPASYSMQHLVDDVHAVLDTYLVDEADLVGYSLGARVAWHASLDGTPQIRRAVLGGIPDSRPLTRFQVGAARAHLHAGAALDDRLTAAYIELARRSPDNDLDALVALVEGLQEGLQPDPARPPQLPVLFATGSEDGILDASRRLAAATPLGRFYEILGRNHFNAPTSRPFRDQAIAFLQAADTAVDAPDGAAPAVGGAVDVSTQVSVWRAGLAAVLFAQSSDSSVDAALSTLQREWDRWLRCLALADRLAAPPGSALGGPGAVQVEAQHGRDEGTA